MALRLTLDRMQSFVSGSKSLNEFKKAHLIVTNALSTFVNTRHVRVASFVTAPDVLCAVLLTVTCMHLANFFVTLFCETRNYSYLLRVMFFYSTGLILSRANEQRRYAFNH